MTTDDIRSLLQSSNVRKYKGQFRYHVSYFYRNNMTPETLENKVRTKLPNAKIVESGDHYHPFVGGSESGSSKDSYMWVKFTV